MLQDFGESPILLGRMTDDTGTMGLLGAAGAFIGFAFNPLVGLGIGLVMANDIANARRSRHLLTDTNDTAALPSDKPASHGLNPATEEKFKGVQPQIAVKSSAQSSQMTGPICDHMTVESIPRSSTDDRGELPGKGWGYEAKEDWLNETAPTWAPPAPDLSLLPISAYRDAVPAGTIDAKQLSDTGVRQMATDKIFGLVTTGQFANMEHLVWAVFGLSKGGNDWYAIASDFCRHCKEHFINGPSSSRNDSSVTW